MLFDRFHRTRPFVGYYSPAYRLPFSSAEATGDLQPRRSDDALWYLLERRVLREKELRVPTPIPYADVLRVHSPVYLESLSQPETLAQIYALDPSDVPVDEVLQLVRLACGGTLEGARASLASRVPALNFLGGFHHAGPERGGGFCALNDIAIAVSALRADGFGGQVAVLDLDAHPPDGTSECLRSDARVWLGSLSGSDWGPLPGVDETVLPRGCEDGPYLDALAALLGRMPPAELTFVLAGGDVLAGDRFGVLGLTLDGARRRDEAVEHACRGRASVWLPAGGYRGDAWKVLAGTGLVLGGRLRHRIPAGVEPLHLHFLRIGRKLTSDELSGASWLTEGDLEETLHIPGAAKRRFLGFYTREGLELALERYGILGHLARLGYPHVHLELDELGDSERLRVLPAEGDGAPLMEVALSRRVVAGGNYLYVNWLTLRNPRVHFSDQRPQLPGQDVPGLGIAREVSEVLGIMAERLGLDGVAFRPGWYHMAYAARRRFRFADDARQARFEALMRDLRGMSLLDATRAVDGGRVLLDGAPYHWEADEMVQRRPASSDAAELPRLVAGLHFQLGAEAKHEERTDAERSPRGGEGGGR